MICVISIVWFGVVFVNVVVILSLVKVVNVIVNMIVVLVV